MLKKTVTYTDYDDNQAVDTIYFNLSKAELMDNLGLMERFQELMDISSDGKRQLAMSEIQKILDLVKEVMRLSYGVKSADGKRFVKGDEQWRAFKEEAVYDAFLMSLFENPEEANNFLLGVFPKDLMESAKRQIELGVAPQVVENAQIRIAPEPDESPVEDTRPAYMREERDPTNAELQAMDKDQLVVAMQWKTSLRPQ